MEAEDSQLGPSVEGAKKAAASRGRPPSRERAWSTGRNSCPRARGLDCNILLSRHDGYIMKMYALASKQQPPAGRDTRRDMHLLLEELGIDHVICACF